MPHIMEWEWLFPTNTRIQQNDHAYASRTLNKHEINYSQIDKEGAAIIFGLKKFNQYLLGRHFTISTDNKALRTIFDLNTATSPIAASRLVRWSLFLSQYNYSIQFKSSSEHYNADMLSRLPLVGKSDHIEEVTICHMQIASLPVSADKIRDQTRRDTVLMSVVKFLIIGQWPKSIASVLQPYYNRRFELSIEGDVIMGIKSSYTKIFATENTKRIAQPTPRYS